MLSLTLKGSQSSGSILAIFMVRTLFIFDAPHRPLPDDEKALV
jgi:hypothetical protein